MFLGPQLSQVIETVATRTRAFGAAGIAKNTGRVALSVSLAGSLISSFTLVSEWDVCACSLPEPYVSTVV